MNKKNKSRHLRILKKMLNYINEETEIFHDMLFIGFYVCCSFSHKIHCKKYGECSIKKCDAKYTVFYFLVVIKTGYEN